MIHFLVGCFLFLVILRLIAGMFGERAMRIVLTFVAGGGMLVFIFVVAMVATHWH